MDDVITAIAGPFSGSIVDMGGEIQPCDSRNKRAAGNYKAVLNMPDKEDAEADGLLLLEYPDLGSNTRVIALVGRPIGFGKYRWKGLCPKIRTLVRVLHNDSDMKLFVAKTAIGTAAPAAVDRYFQGFIIERYLRNKYGRPDIEKFRLRKMSTNSAIRDFPKIVAHIAIPLLQKDRIFALNGLPMMVWDGERVDVLRSIRAPKKFEKFTEDMVANFLGD